MVAQSATCGRLAASRRRRCPARACPDPRCAEAAPLVAPRRRLGVETRRRPRSAPSRRRSRPGGVAGSCSRRAPRTRRPGCAPTADGD